MSRKVPHDPHPSPGHVPKVPDGCLYHPASCGCCSLPDCELRDNLTPLEVQQ